MHHRQTFIVLKYGARLRYNDSDTLFSAPSLWTNESCIWRDPDLYLEQLCPMLIVNLVKAHLADPLRTCAKLYMAFTASFLVNEPPYLIRQSNYIDGGLDPNYPMQGQLYLKKKTYIHIRYDVNRLKLSAGILGFIF